MKRTDTPIKVEQYFNSSPAIIWKALTDPEEMRQWFFEQIPDFRAEVGFYTEFTIVNEGRSFTHCWTIREVVPEKKIAYRWKYPEYTGDSNVHFEIEARDSGSLLRVSTEVLEDFQDDIPEFKRESCQAGWEYFIQNRLPEYLDQKSF